jgi:hypothetical protein
MERGCDILVHARSWMMLLILIVLLKNPKYELQRESLGFSMFPAALDQFYGDRWLMTAKSLPNPIDCHYA